MARKHFCLIVVTCLIAFITAFSGAKEADPSSAPEKKGDIEFILKPTYKIGEKIEFKLKNTGKDSYGYNQKYPACDLSYSDASGRDFIIPQGTHCDMVVTVEIKPGETKKLFEWDQNECVLDEFGCSKKEPLPVGKYTIKGTFFGNVDQDRSTEAIAVIEIVQ